MVEGDTRWLMVIGVVVEMIIAKVVHDKAGSSFSNIKLNYFSVRFLNLKTKQGQQNSDFSTFNFFGFIRYCITFGRREEVIVSSC